MKGEDDKKRFSVVLFWLANRMMAPGGLPRKIDSGLQADYFTALSDIRIERIEWAAKHLFATETWFPMPKDLRTAAMIAPSSVMPQISNNMMLLPEVTPEQAARNLEKLNEIMENIGVGKFEVK